MRFVTLTIFAVTGSLVSLAIANPVINRKARGIAIPLTRHPSSLNSNKSIDLDTISSHAMTVREKILSGLENYEMNTGTMHPFAVKRGDSEFRLGRRGGSIALTISQDQMWTGEISIGTPPKTLEVIIDTGSADMWVLETGCTGISRDRDLWGPDLSDTIDYDGQPFRIDYVDGTVVQGDLWIDNVTIGGLTSDPQTFGSATSFTRSQMQNNIEYPADGLLGFAFPSMSKFGAEPLFQSLVKQNRLINPTISLKLSSSGAEMYIGGSNSMLYNGDITYTPITNPGYWQVSISDVRVDGKTVLKNVPAVVDTGSNYILGDWKRVEELYRPIGATLHENHGLGFYYLPCDSFPTLGLTFGSRTFRIPPEVLRLEPIEEGSPNCFSAVIAQNWPIGFWTIGAPFLQGVYSVFDYSTLQVGFADLA